MIEVRFLSGVPAIDFFSVLVYCYLMAEHGSVPQTPDQTPLVSRRRFLGGALGLATATVIGSSVVLSEIAAAAEGSTQSLLADQTFPSDTTLPPPMAPEASPASEQSETTENDIKDDQAEVMDEDRGTARDSSYMDTAIKTGINYAINTGISRVSRFFGVKTGRAKSAGTELEKALVRERLADSSRLGVYAELGDVAVGSPVVEEVIFRALPSLIIKDAGNAWTAGTISSGLFAAAHAYDRKTGNTSLPVQQFNLGMLTWWLQRNRGFKHAVLSHALNNTPSAVSIAAKYEMDQR